MKLVRLTAVVAVLALAVLASPAQAGGIILEGSDAIGFHYNQAYTDQVWSALGGDAGGTPSPKPIGVIGTPAAGTGSLTSNTHAIEQKASLALLSGPLSSYVALYFLAGLGCCTENDALVVGNEAAISAYLAGGGTVMINDYIGGAAWDFAIGTGGTGNSHVAGFAGGILGAPGCDDGEMVTADGLLNGFTQPPALGCWTHQGYDLGYFSTLGFSKNFYDSPAGYSGLGIGAFGSLISNGTTASAPDVPEPASLTLIGISAFGLLGYSWRRRKVAVK